MVIFEFTYFNNYLLDSLSCVGFKSKTVESDSLASLPPPPATCVTGHIMSLRLTCLPHCMEIVMAPAAEGHGDGMRAFL